MRDLYEVLGVERGASQADLKKAYRRLAQEHHPDRNPENKDAEEKFKEAANAYQILSNDEQRAAYDRFGFDGLRGRAGGGPGGGFSNAEDIFSAFGDLFGDFFGGRSSGGRRQPRGADLRVDLELTFAEAVWGCTKDVKVARDIACAGCKGSGAAPGSKAETCKTCQGKGQVVHRCRASSWCSRRARIAAARAILSNIRFPIVAAAVNIPRPRSWASRCPPASTTARR